jgi:hypothetical protein
MSQALAAGPGGGAIPTHAQCRPLPPGNAVPQGVIPQRPRYTEQQMRQILASKTIPESAKATALETYQSQNQPVEMNTLGGKMVIGRDGTQFFVPEPKWGNIEAGDAKTFIPKVYDPKQNAFVPLTPPTALQGANRLFRTTCRT